MTDMPSLISSDERIDEVLGLANELDIGFGAALKLYRKGYGSRKAVRSLTVRDIAEITGLPVTAAERVAMNVASRKERKKMRKAAEGVEVEEPIEVTIITEKKAEGRHKFEVHPIKGTPKRLSEDSKIKFNKYYRIDPDMRKVWVWSGVGFTLLMVFVCLLPFAFLFFNQLLLFVVIILTAAAFGVAVWWSQLMYENYTFGFTRDIVVVRFGVLWKTEIHIPYGRIQNINSHQGILDRIFGVWHLAISATGAISIIHGVPKHDMVKMFILENVEAVKAKRAPKLDDAQGYREVYLVLKSISRNLESYHSRAIIAHR